MTNARLEHANITVRDVAASAALYCKLFDWDIRWHGAAIAGGTTYHVGGPDSYLALYSHGGAGPAPDSYQTVGALNHIGVVVDDLAAIEARVRDAGLKPRDAAAYEPGKRFYFDDPDGIEVEVVSYTG